VPTAARQPEVEPTPAQTQEEQDRDATIRKAYSAAAKELRERHRDEFNALQQKHAKEMGVEWSPRLTPEDRAAQQMESLFAEFPGLRERMLSGNGEAPVEEPTDL